MFMAELLKTVEEIYNTNLEKLEVFECEDEFSDTQSFCDHYGYKIEDSCNALLIKSKKPEEFYSLFFVLCSSRLDVNHKAKSLMGARKVSFASREEAEEVTNQIYGGISPLGLVPEIKIFIDREVLNREKIFIGAGNRLSKFFLTPESLVELTQGTLEDLT